MGYKVAAWILSPARTWQQLIDSLYKARYTAPHHDMKFSLARNNLKCTTKCHWLISKFALQSFAHASHEVLWSSSALCPNLKDLPSDT